MSKVMEATLFGLGGVLVTEAFIFFLGRLRRRNNQAGRVIGQGTGSEEKQELLNAAQKLLEVTSQNRPGAELAGERKEAWLWLAKQVKAERARSSLEVGTDAEISFALRELRALGEDRDLPAIGAVLERRGVGENVRDLAGRVGRIIEERNQKGFDVSEEIEEELITQSSKSG